MCSESRSSRHVFRCPSRRMSVLLSTWLMAACFTISCFGDNGEVAYAVPVEGISIDGNLKDWPRDLQRFDIRQEYYGNALPSETDCRASFQVGYNVDDQSLYVAVTVVDEEHNFDPSGEAIWSSQDSLGLYIDSIHAPEGSGPRLYMASGPHRQLPSIEYVWDPFSAGATWDDVELSVVREGVETNYEWRIAMGEHMKPGRSIGFDFILSDHDQNNDGRSLLTWSPGGQKSQGASRCGDLILLDPDQPTGTLRGFTGWELVNGEPLHESFPFHRMRITSVDNPLLWTIARLNSDGKFEVDLPHGDYRLGFPHETYENDQGEIFRIDPARSVTVTVERDATTDASPLWLTTIDSPDLIGPQGVLLDYDTGTAAKVDQFMETYMEYFQTPGVSLALISDNKLVYHKTYGVRNYFTGLPVADETLFEACSITKIVFAFAVNRMAERGEIDLDKPLHEYLPFEDISHDSRYKQITARHCLSHQTGFPNWRSDTEKGEMEIRFYPGTKFGYSGEGMEYLGRVVSEITGKTLEEVIMSEVQTPMGFETNTFFSDCPELQQVVANGHYTTRTMGTRMPTAIGVAHSMHTEARTLSNFMLGLLERKELSARQYAEMFRPQVAQPLADDAELPWPQYFGLGFHLRDTPYGWSFGHGGSNGDFKCQFEAYPDQKCGFIIFTNGYSGTRLIEELRKFLIAGSVNENSGTSGTAN